MSRCADDNCIYDHVRPRLKSPVPHEEGDGYDSYAPCHEDSGRRSLSVSYENDRILWCCHACQNRIGKEMAQIRTRSALIKAGVPARCLPVPRELMDAMLDMIRDVLHSDMSQVDKVYRLAVLTECGGEMPGGTELSGLAEWCGVSQRAAYRARGASTDNL